MERGSGGDAKGEIVEVVDAERSSSGGGAFRVEELEGLDDTGVAAGLGGGAGGRGGPPGTARADAPLRVRVPVAGGARGPAGASGGAERRRRGLRRRLLDLHAAAARRGRDGGRQRAERVAHDLDPRHRRRVVQQFRLRRGPYLKDHAGVDPAYELCASPPSSSPVGPTSNTGKTLVTVGLNDNRRRHLPSRIVCFSLLTVRECSGVHRTLSRMYCPYSVFQTRSRHAPG